MSNKKSGNFDKEMFKQAVKEVMQYLALEIVRDGEGATKVVATAIFGEDPNWGRIASTIGASGITCKEELLSISFDDVCLFKKGKVFFDDTYEQQAKDVMRGRRHCFLYAIRRSKIPKSAVNTIVAGLSMPAACKTSNKTATITATEP